MDKNRAYHIRLEIDRLKRELAEIEQANLSPDERTDSATAMTCGHDVIIENLRSTARRLGQNGRAVLAGWQENRGGSNPWWYSTTISPEVIPYNIRDVSNLVDVFKLFCNVDVMNLMQVLFQHENGLTQAELSKNMQVSAKLTDKITSTLKENGYISESGDIWFLNSKGWQYFMVISHLIWFQNLKLSPAKAIEIAPALQEVFSIYWGEYLGKDTDTALEELKDNGWLEKLYEKGLVEEDIRKAIYEHNYKKKRSNKGVLTTKSTRTAAAFCKYSCFAVY